MPQPDNSHRREFVLGNGSKLVLLIGDITRESCDAIVNAANSSLMGGGGVDGAIHDAGGPAILDECKAIVHRIGPLPAGQVVVTAAGEMLSKRVIHTVGPVWYGGDREEAATLANCYRNALRLADSEELRSIAFPSISTGAFRYPVDQAAAIAVRAVSEEVPKLSNLKEVRFVLFDVRTHKHYVNAAHNVCTRADQT